ncbi:hypothetical protein ACFE04_004070 [Oxalis oulophora]
MLTSFIDAPLLFFSCLTTTSDATSPLETASLFLSSLRLATSPLETDSDTAEETLTEFSKRRVSENKFFHNTSTSTVAVDWDSSLRKDESSSDNDVNLVAFEEEEEEEKIKVKKEKEELFGFNRSEVTVIDTSFDV